MFVIKLYCVQEIRWSLSNGVGVVRSAQGGFGASTRHPGVKFQPNPRTPIATSARDSALSSASEPLFFQVIIIVVMHW